MAADPAWHPGKREPAREKPGPKPKLTKAKKLCIARSAMALKSTQGVEPSVAAVVENCPSATLNPETEEPFTDKYILRVFRQYCFDDGADNPWDLHYPYQKTALPDWLKAQRLTWAKAIKQLKHTAAWFAQHVVWMDPCNTVVPGRPRSAFDATQASYGKDRRWMSKDKKAWSRNQRAAPYGGKQAQWGDKRIWWFVIVSRGVVHLCPMEEDWAQTAQGMASMVDKLDGILRKMLGASAHVPRVVFTDRGPGFYQGSTGSICTAYKEALGRHEFRPFAGNNATWQPADMPDLFPHERVVSWVRLYFKKHPFSRSADIDANCAAFLKTLKAAEKHINDNYDVAGVCSGVPAKVELLIEKKGERLPK